MAGSVKTSPAVGQKFHAETDARKMYLFHATLFSKNILGGVA